MLKRNRDQASYATQMATSWEVPYPGEVRDEQTDRQTDKQTHKQANKTNMHRTTQKQNQYCRSMTFENGMKIRHPILPDATSREVPSPGNVRDKQTDRETETTTKHTKQIATIKSVW